MALGLWVASAPACAQGNIDPDALGAIEHTRNTTATYSVYSWTVISPPGVVPVEEWAAEFHDGHLHRVETPRDRIVADCAAQTGTHLNLTTGKLTRGPNIATAACGVHANAPMLAADEEPGGDGRFGKTRRITLHDPQYLRTYEIAANGAIVAATIADLEETLLLDSRAVALRDIVPDDIFSEESLASSVVGEEYRKDSSN